MKKYFASIIIFATLVGATFATPTRIVDLGLEPSPWPNVVGPYVANNLLVVQWSKPTATGTLSEYDVRVSDVPITTLNWNSRRRVLIATPAAFGSMKPYAVIDGLISNKLYYIAVKASDGVWCLMSNAVSVTTNYNDKRQRISWQPGTSKDANGVSILDPNVKGYNVHIRSQSGVEQVIDVGLNLYYDITGLTFGVTYTHWISAYNSNRVEVGSTNTVVENR